MNELTPINEGIAATVDPGMDPMVAQQKAREAADVQSWFKKLDAGRKFDEPARRQYALDRRYARGDSGFEVDANIVGTNIDILESFLYARDPDFDVSRAQSVRMPSVEALRDAAEQSVSESPEPMMAGRQAAAMAVMMGLPQDQAVMQGQMVQEAKAEEMVSQRVKEIRKAFARREREIKAFAETCEVIGSSMWRDASLKRRGRPWVRSGLTIGIGCLKASWQERTAQSPETAQAINDLQANIARAKSLQREIEEGNPGFISRAVQGVANVLGVGEEAKVAELERQLTALQTQAERVVARGYVIDGVAGEDFQVAPGFTIANHLDAPWNAHRIFVSYDDALAEFGPHLSRYGRPEELLGGAIQYRARKPSMVQSESPTASTTQVSANEADAFVGPNDSSGANDSQPGDKSSAFLALWEIWDRDSNTVLTGIEGVQCWVKPQWTPPATTRFYPFFLFCMSEVDGQRHPQSPVTRTMKLVDEYNRIGSAEAEHRRRTRPKTAFNAGLLPPTDARKLESGGTQEMVGVTPTQPNTPIGNILQPIVYAQIDPALYDRNRIIQEIERVWAIQEALGGAVNNVKTATEADIQQQGFQARASGRRDLLETSLSELALYTVEIARKYITQEDAQHIAGPDAFWPPYGGPDDLGRLVNVQVRAGSSGKPNTTAERQSWSTMLPLLQSGIVEIGKLRQSSPSDIADSLEQLLRITADKAGDRIDIDQLIPQAGPAPAPAPPVPGGTGIPGAPPPAAPEPTPPGGDPSADPLATAA